MGHHEDSHGNDHGHDNTEGNRQYYPQGWYLPLLALCLVAVAFAFGAGSLLGISGTDKWGAKQEHVCDDHCGADCEHKDAHHDAGHGDAHHDADHHNADHNHDAPKTDSMTVAHGGDSVPKADSPAKVEAHGH